MRKKQMRELKLAIEMRDKQRDMATIHAKEAERREAEVQRLIGELEREIEEATGLSCNIGCKWGTTGDSKARHDSVIPDGVDVGDPNTWQEGDMVECVALDADGFGVYTIGNKYEVVRIEEARPYPCLTIDDEGDHCWSGASFRFVRRPS